MHNGIFVCHFSCVRFFATQWTAACQAPPSVEFSRQEYWSGLPSPAPGDLPNPEIKHVSLKSPALAGRLEDSTSPALVFQTHHRLFWWKSKVTYKNETRGKMLTYLAPKAAWTQLQLFSYCISDLLRCTESIVEKSKHYESDRLDSDAYQVMWTWTSSTK